MIVNAERPATTSNLHQRIGAVYNFKPHELDQSQIEQHSAVLDQFWKAAKGNPNYYVDQLRLELQDFSNPPFFLYDGSKLLLDLTKAPSDNAVVLAAISRCDIRDVSPEDYFRLVHRIGLTGQDTTAAAFHTLDDPKFQVFIPQHSLTLGQGYSLLYLLFLMKEQDWVPRAIDRLKVTTDETAQTSLLLALSCAQTNEADEAIQNFSHDSHTARLILLAKELLKGASNGSLPTRVTAAFRTEASLRAARREALKSISDEALYDFVSYTKEIASKRH